MKKITLLSITLFCMMLLTSVTGFGQGTIQIGSGASTITGSAAMPVSNYVYNYNQQIVTANEYASGGGVEGEITKIRYYATNVGTTTVWDQWTVYIGNTAKTSFTSTTDWVPLAELTQVFSGTITAVANEWFEVTFTAPFNYTGGNIVVAVHEYAPGWTSPPTFRSYSSAANSGIYYRNDGTNPNPATPPTATGRNANLPQIQFEGALASCLPPAALTASNISLTTADLGWSESGTSTNWDIEWGTDGFAPTGTPNVNDTGDNPYNLTGLTEGTAYDYYVRSDCGMDDTDVSAWVGPFSFTTIFPAPECATTPFPADEASDVATGELTFTWSPPATGVTPTSYNLYVFDNANGDNPMLVGDFEDESADLVISGYNEIIFWGVVPVNGDTEATGCDVWSFITEDAPVGAVCENAIIVTTPLPYLTSDDTANYGDDYGAADRPSLAGAQYTNGTGSDFYLTGNDVVYSFTPTEDGVFNFDLTLPTSDWHALWLFEGCSPFTSVVAYHTSTSGASRSLPEINLVGGNTYYVVVATWENSPQSTPYDLSITQITCPEPSDLTAENISQTSADLGWTENGSASNWDIEWGIDGFTPTGTPNVNDTADNPYNLTGLEEDSEYDFYVRADCGADDTSDASVWVGPFGFTTLASCPDPSALVVSNITPTSADLGWTAGGTETLWDIELVDITAGGTATGTPTSTGVANPFTQTGLTAANDYEFYVRADCTGGDFSTWEGPFSFTTLCNPETVFPSTTDFTNNPPTSCWSEAGSGEVADGPSGLGASDWKAGRAYTDASAVVINSNVINLWQSVDREWLISPVYDIPVGIPHSLVVNVAVTNYQFSGTSDDTDTDTMGSDDEVQLLQSIDGGTTWTNITTWNVGNQPAVTGTEFIADLTAVSGTIQFALWASDGTVDDTEDYDFHIGEFTVIDNATLSIEENEVFIGFKYYPNPVKGTLSLRAQNAIQIVSIYNMLGQEVLRSSPNALNSEIDMASLQTGAYFVKVTINDATETIRVIKQ